jgi:type VI secretion system protein ImpB
MPGKPSSQDFIGRNRPPRVHISYQTYVDGAQAKIELPFVMGVMSDLSGDVRSETPLPALKDRKFLEFDAKTFTENMKAIKPRVAFTVPNTLTGQGNLPVDITFESMDDFSPAAIARKVEGLNKLLEARTQLKNLLTQIDGRSDTEDLLAKVLEDPTLLRLLVETAKPGGEPKV